MEYNHTLCSYYKDSFPKWDHSLLHKKKVSTHKSRSSCTAAITFSVLKIYTINPPILGLSSLLLSLLAFPPCPTLFWSLQTSACTPLSLCHSAFPSLIHLCHEIQFLWALPQKNTVISNPHVMPWWLTDPGTYVQLLYFFFPETFCFQILKSASCQQSRCSWQLKGQWGTPVFYLSWTWVK